MLLHLDVPPAPIHFITMVVINKFKPSAQRHQYYLTVIDVLTNFTCYILLHTKKADKVIHAYLVNISAKCGELHKILSDNSSE